MEIEQLEIRDFLHRCAPFDQLAAGSLDELVDVLEIDYKRKGEEVLAIGQLVDEVFLLRTGAVEIFDAQGNLCAHRDAGEFFAYSALLSDRPLSRSIRAIEDSLLYVIPKAPFCALLSTDPALAVYFSEKKSERLREATQTHRQPFSRAKPGGYQHQNQLLSSSVGEISQRSALVVTPQTSVVDAAKLLAKYDSRSAVLVADSTGLKGVITEREFCDKVVAAGLDASSPVAEIMTTNPITVTAKTPASDALLLMARHNIHHLPFVSKSSDSNDFASDYSMLTGKDLLHFQSHNPIYLINDINNAMRLETLVALSAKLPALLVDLVQSSLTAYDIGHLISSVGAAITRRLVCLGERQLENDGLGKPPIEYAFVVAGSMAREEQTAHSDQDNGLILSDDFVPELHDAWFLALGKYVSDGLAECGYIYCPGDVMATNPQWRVTVSQWRKYFENWVLEPEKKSLMYASIFFDLRTIHGDEAVLSGLLEEVLAITRGNQRFLANMAANALTHTPPLGLFRQFVLEAGGAEEKALNLKKRGVVPVTDLARVYCLAAGVNGLHTQDRLEAAAEAGQLSQSGKADLVDAYEFIGSVRLAHQCRQIEHGQAPDNYVSPEFLSSFERRHLKDAFEVVRILQASLKSNYL